MKQERRGFSVFLILGILGFLCIGGVTYLYLKNAAETPKQKPADYSIASSTSNKINPVQTTRTQNLQSSSSPDLNVSAETNVSSSASTPFTLSVSPDFGSAPLRVVATYTVKSGCLPYTLDWSDDSPVVQSTATSSACTDTPIRMQEAHVYQKQGTFSLNISNGDKITYAPVYVSLGPPVSFIFNSPAKDAVYKAGEAVPITWSATVPGNFNASAYQVSFYFLPLGAHDNMQYVYAAPWTPLTGGSVQPLTWVVPEGYSGTYQMQAIVIVNDSSGSQIIRKVLSDPFTLEP